MLDCILYVDESFDSGNLIAELESIYLKNKSIIKLVCVYHDKDIEVPHCHLGIVGVVSSDVVNMLRELGFRINNLECSGFVNYLKYLRRGYEEKNFICLLG